MTLPGQLAADATARIGQLIDPGALTLRIFLRDWYPLGQ